MTLAEACAWLDRIAAEHGHELADWTATQQPPGLAAHCRHCRAVGYVLITDDDDDEHGRPIAGELPAVCPGAVN